MSVTKAAALGLTKAETNLWFVKLLLPHDNKP
jgi:hypothetical protein